MCHSTERRVVVSKVVRAFLQHHQIREIMQRLLMPIAKRELHYGGILAFVLEARAMKFEVVVCEDAHQFSCKATVISCYETKGLLLNMI